jgi:hypothetical protein
MFLSKAEVDFSASTAAGEKASSEAETLRDEEDEA